MDAPAVKPFLWAVAMKEINISRGKEISMKQHILSNIQIITETGCWIWMRGLDYGGYGIVNIPGKNKSIRAHRASYKEFNGNIPDKLHVLHSCDIRCCCNPSHLRLGTNAENMNDKCKKGRHRNRYTGKLHA